MAYALRPSLAQAGNEGKWRILGFREYNRIEYDPYDQYDITMSDQNPFDGCNYNAYTGNQNAPMYMYAYTTPNYHAHFDFMLYQTSNIWELSDASYYSVTYRSPGRLSKWNATTKTWDFIAKTETPPSPTQNTWSMIWSNLEANVPYRYTSESPRYIGQWFIEEANNTRFLFRKGTTVYWYTNGNFVPTPTNTTTDMDFMMYGSSTMPDVAKLNGLVVLLKYIPVKAYWSNLTTNTFKASVVGDIAVATVTMEDYKADIRQFGAQ